MPSRSRKRGRFPFEREPQPQAQPEEQDLRGHQDELDMLARTCPLGEQDLRGLQEELVMLASSWPEAQALADIVCDSIPQGEELADGVTVLLGANDVVIDVGNIDNFIEDFLAATAISIQSQSTASSIQSHSVQEEWNSLTVNIEGALASVGSLVQVFGGEPGLRQHQHRQRRRRGPGASARRKQRYRKAKKEKVQKDKEQHARRKQHYRKVTTETESGQQARQRGSGDGGAGAAGSTRGPRPWPISAKWSRVRRLSIKRRRIHGEKERKDQAHTQTQQGASGSPRRFSLSSDVSLDVSEDVSEDVSLSLAVSEDTVDRGDGSLHVLWPSPFALASAGV